MITFSSLAAWVAVTGIGASEYPPADPKATRQVRKLLTFLRDQQGKALVSGQTDLRDAVWVRENTGNHPAILALDFMRVPKRMGGMTTDTQTALDWVNKQGGIVSYQWHWTSPQGAKDLEKGFYTNSTSFDLSTVLADPKSDGYRELIKDIDDVAQELKRLSAAKVPVLFRPLHEAQGKWFWWGAEGPESCLKLYHLLFDRLTRHHRLHNLAWVWTASPASQGKGDPAKWYPGDEYVDVIASDYCESERDFRDLTALTGGKKLVALAETMNAPDPDKALKTTPWAYWVTWARRDWNNRSADDMNVAMSKAATITRDRLPNVRRW